MEDIQSSRVGGRRPILNPKSFNLSDSEWSSLRLPPWRHTVETLVLDANGRLPLWITAVEFASDAYMPSSSQQRPWCITSRLLKPISRSESGTSSTSESMASESPHHTPLKRVYTQAIGNAPALPIRAPPKKATFATLFGVDSEGVCCAVHVEYSVYMHLRIVPSGSSASSASVKALNHVVSSLLESMTQSRTIHAFSKCNKASLMGFVPESIDCPTKKRTTPIWKIDFANLSERWTLIGTIRNGLAEFGFDAVIEMVDDNKLLTAEVMWYQQAKISAGVWVAFDAERLLELDGPTMMTNCQVELSCDTRLDNGSNSSFVVPSLSSHQEGAAEMSFARSAPITKFHWHAEPSLDFIRAHVEQTHEDTGKQEALINGGSFLNIQSAESSSGLPVVINDATPIAAISIVIECGEDDESTLYSSSPRSSPNTTIKQLVYVEESSSPHAKLERRATLDYFSRNGYELVPVSSEKECLHHWRNALVVTSPEVVHGPGSFTNQWRWLIARAAVSSGRAHVTIQDRSVNPRRPSDLARNEGQVVKFLPDSPVPSYGYGNSWLSTFMVFSRSNTQQVTLSRRMQTIPGTGADTEVICASIYGACDIDVCHYEKMNNKKMVYYDVGSLCEYYCHEMSRSDLLSRAVAVMRSIGLAEFVLASASASLVSMDDVFKKGPQFAFTRSVCVHAYSRNLLIEPEEKQLTPKEGMITYTGAHVFESLPGVWTSPMLEFDFASFFTSIILSTGFCFSKLMVPFTTDDNGNIFVCDQWKYPPDFEARLCKLYGQVDHNQDRSSLFSAQRSSARTWRIVDGGHTFHFMDPGKSTDANDQSLSFHMLEEFASRRAQCRRLMEAIKADPLLYNAQTSTWLSQQAKLTYDSLFKLANAFKLKGNATYGGFASLGRFRCVAVSAATTDLARLLLQEAASRVIDEWSLSRSLHDDLRDRLNAEVAASLAQHADGTKSALTGLNDYCKKYYAPVRNPFGLVLVQGDSDAFHICVTCIQPREGTSTLSSKQLDLAEDIGLCIQSWISRNVLTDRFGLPRINMEFKQLAFPTIITTAKKRFAAKVWNIGARTQRTLGNAESCWCSKTVLKSFDEKMDIPPLVQHAITNAVEDILANCGVSSVEQVQRVAYAPLREAIVALKSAMSTEALRLDSFCAALVPFTKFQRYSRSASLTANGNQTSPARSAASRMSSDVNASTHAFAVGDRIGFIVEGPRNFLALRHIHVSSKKGSVAINKCPNGHSLCNMTIRRGGAGQDVSIVPLPSVAHYEELVSNQITPLISLLVPSSTKSQTASGFGSSSFFGKQALSACATSMPSLVQCASMGCGVPMSNAARHVAEKTAALGRTTSSNEQSTESRKRTPFFYMLKKR